jgi:hypothetical protein
MMNKSNRTWMTVLAAAAFVAAFVAARPWRKRSTRRSS